MLVVVEKLGDGWSYSRHDGDRITHAVAAPAPLPEQIVELFRISPMRILGLR